MAKAPGKGQPSKTEYFQTITNPHFGQMPWKKLWSQPHICQHIPNEESQLPPSWWSNEVPNIPAGVVSGKSEPRTGTFIPLIWWPALSPLSLCCHGVSGDHFGNLGALELPLPLGSSDTLLPPHWSGVRGVLMENQGFYLHPAVMRPCHHGVNGDCLGSQSFSHCPSVMRCFLTTTTTTLGGNKAWMADLVSN